MHYNKKMAKLDKNIHNYHILAQSQYLFNPLVGEGDLCWHIVYICVSAEGNFSWHNQNALIQSFMFFFEASKYLQNIKMAAMKILFELYSINNYILCWPT